MRAECVAAMEDVLALYAEPYDPRRPTVTFDETSLRIDCRDARPSACPARTAETQ